MSHRLIVFLAIGMIILKKGIVDFDAQKETRFTRHARLRMAQRDVTVGSVRSALRDPTRVLSEESAIRIEKEMGIRDCLVVYVAPKQDYNLVISVWIEQ